MEIKSTLLSEQLQMDAELCKHYKSCSTERSFTLTTVHFEKRSNLHSHRWCEEKFSLLKPDFAANQAIETTTMQQSAAAKHKALHEIWKSPHSRDTYVSAPHENQSVTSVIVKSTTAPGAYQKLLHHL